MEEILELEWIECHRQLSAGASGRLYKFGFMQLNGQIRDREIAGTRFGIREDEFIFEQDDPG